MVWSDPYLMRKVFPTGHLCFASNKIRGVPHPPPGPLGPPLHPAPPNVEEGSYGGSDSVLVTKRVLVVLEKRMNKRPVLGTCVALCKKFELRREFHVTNQDNRNKWIIR
uniref:Uncharacterized protein n=1 Tax=Cacopsylla melanoneura TaxID=428564 RepID=A0A8D8Z4K0_9HEMI